MAVIPRTPIQCECTDCDWQGTWQQTDAGVCPECGAEVVDIAEKSEE